jgi:hypothetical protein
MTIFNGYTRNYQNCLTLLGQYLTMHVHFWKIIAFLVMIVCIWCLLYVTVNNECNLKLSKPIQVLKVPKIVELTNNPELKNVDSKFKAEIRKRKNRLNRLNCRKIGSEKDGINLPLQNIYLLPPRNLLMVSNNKSWIE